MTAQISEFQGKYRFLSNFWPAEVHLDSILYPSVEHAYQASKSLDPVYRKRIQLAQTPGLSKSLGRRVHTLRPNWDDLKLSIMYDLVKEKFFSHSYLASRLLDTGHANLIEGNNWNDTFWGVCRGRGSNHLGIILMTVRSQLRERSK